MAVEAVKGYEALRKYALFGKGSLGKHTVLVTGIDLSAREAWSRIAHFCEYKS